MVKISILCNYALLNISYSKLKAFSKVEEDKSPLNIPISDNKNINEKIEKLASDDNNTPDKFEKFWEIEAYLNSMQFMK